LEEYISCEVSNINYYELKELHQKFNSWEIYDIIGESISENGEELLG
jgi:hypothetical protein